MLKLSHCTIRIYPSKQSWEPLRRHTIIHEKDLFWDDLTCILYTLYTNILQGGMIQELLDQRNIDVHQESFTACIMKGKGSSIHLPPNHDAISCIPTISAADALYWLYQEQELVFYRQNDAFSTNVSSHGRNTSH